jgi:hypothetical protein
LPPNLADSCTSLVQGTELLADPDLTLPILVFARTRIISFANPRMSVVRIGEKRIQCRRLLTDSFGCRVVDLKARWPWPVFCAGILPPCEESLSRSCM